MKVNHQVTVSLSVTVFDDGKRWVHVDISRMGHPARTVYNSRANRTLSMEELDLALAVLAECSQTEVNHFRRSQEALF